MPDSEKGFKPESLYKSVYDKLGQSLQQLVIICVITSQGKAYYKLEECSFLWAGASLSQTGNIIANPFMAITKYKVIEIHRGTNELFEYVYGRISESTKEYAIQKWT